MTDDPCDGADDLDLLDRFFAEYANAADPETELARWIRKHPRLTEEFRLLAVFDVLAALRVPSEVAGVELLGPVGRGGMGLVYEGVERSVGRSVAVKLCPAVGDAAGRNRFLAECRILAGLHQTSIVPILAAGREGLWLYCVMPLLDGVSLAELVRRAWTAELGPLLPLPALVASPDPGAPANPPDARPIHPGPVYLRSVAEVLIQAADAIAYAHQQGVWHLDLKPANLMVEETGHCWVIDFGLARDARVDGSAGDPESPYLTTAYAAPEQWSGEGDARTDVWGLGVTLYELLTLRRPFGDPPPVEFAATVMAGGRNPTAVRPFTPDVPRDLQAICLKALVRRPEARYSSAAAFAADLRRWLDGEEPAARPWPPLVRAWDLASRHRAWAVAVVASVIGMMAALLLLWRGEQIRTWQAETEADAAITRANLRREADAAAQAQIWTLLEQTRNRLARPVAGRRADVRRLLLAAGRKRRSIAADDEARLLDLTIRSLYIESLGLLDARVSPPGNYLPLPGSSAFQDWPIDIHPDGRTVAIGTARQPLIWRRGGPSPKLAAEDAEGPRSRVVYGPVGGILAELRPPEAGGSLRLWNHEASRLLGEPIRAGSAYDAVLAIGFDCTETRVWAARADGRVESWHLPSLTSAGRWPITHPTLGATAAAFASEAGLVAFGDTAGRIVVYDPAGTAILRFAAPSGRRVETLAWSPDARYLAVGTKDGTVHVFGNGSPVYRVSVSPYGVGHVGFSPDGRWLTAHFRNQEMRLWDAYTGRLLITGLPPIWGFARDSCTFAMAGTDAIRFGELLLPEAVDQFEGHLAAVEQLAWNPNGGRFVTLSSDFEVRVWDVTHPGIPDSVFAAPPSDGFWAQQAAVALGPGGRQVAYASGGRDRSRVVVWDVPTRRQIAEWNLPGGFEKLAPAGSGHFLLVREEVRPDTRNVTSVARLLTVGEPAPAGRMIRPSEPADRSRFIDHWLLPDGRYYLWAGPREPAADRRVELYETDTGRRVWGIRPPTEPNNMAPACLLTEDLRTLWAGDGGLAAYRYSLPPRSPPERVPGMMCAASADGRWLLTGSAGDSGLPRAVVLQRAGVGPWVEFPLRESVPPAGGRYLFSPDGRYLAWGTAAGSIVVVHLPTLEERLNRFEAALSAPE